MDDKMARFGLRAAAAIGVLLLGGCLGQSALDEIKHAQASGSGFDRALFKYYSFLASSFGTVEAPPGTTFDQEGSMAFGDTEYSVSGIADSFARKALDTSNGVDVLPEPGANSDGDAMRT